MRRVVRLLEEGVTGNRILLLSFTRVAAADLRDKVAALAAPGVDEVRATTLHGFCFGLLQQESVLAITERTPRILLEHEVDLMLRDIGGPNGNIHQRRRLLEAFVAGWARGRQDHPGDATHEERNFEDSIMSWLRRHNAMLIGEVVPQAYRFLSANPLAPALEAFDHIIVDEYQDLNWLEQKLLDTLTAKADLCVAGDDDQSIYSVRYANPEGILAFLSNEAVDKHILDVCGRCPENILAVANSLISHAPRRNKKDLKPRDADSDGTIAIVQWPTVDAEVDGIAAAIAQDVSSGRREPGQVLVLANWRKVGERIRRRLVDLGIPAKSFFSEEELSSDEGKEAVALLRLVVNETDAPAIRVMLGLGDATARSEAYQRLLIFCNDNATEARAVLDRLEQGEKVVIAIRALVQHYSRAKGKVQILKALELADLIDALLPADAEETADLRDVALAALSDAKTPRELLRCILEAVTQDEVPQNPNFVRVMSLHKSKGLTSESVYIIGAVDGILPTIRGEDAAAIDAQICEGRRLFYVALTRAANDLVISGSITMDLADANARGVRYDKKRIKREGDRYAVRTIASPYITELGRRAPKPVKGEVWLKSR
jgi:superfamily I DNA/RNA helicase